MDSKNNGGNTDKSMNKNTRGIRKKEEIYSKGEGECNNLINGDVGANIESSVEESTDSSHRTNRIHLGGNVMETMKKENTVGLKDFRSNISNFFDQTINNYTELLVGNAKKGGKTATFLSSDLLKMILNVIKFNPAVCFDGVTNQWAVMIEEIGADGCGDTKDDAISMAVDNALMLLDDYMKNKELYLRMEETKSQYPYFLKLLYCSNIQEVMQALDLK